MSRSIRTLAIACFTVASAAVVPLSFATPVIAAPVSAPDDMAKMSDAHILGMVMAINDAEIGAANAALQEKDVKGDVKDFAQMMVKDHTNNNEAIHKLADKASIKPEMDDATKAMAQKMADDLKQMKMLDKDAFAKAYVDMNVTAHTEALTKLDAAIGAAQNADVKKLLENTRKHVAHHLDEAKKLQEKGAK